MGARDLISYVLLGNVKRDFASELIQNMLRYRPNPPFQNHLSIPDIEVLRAPHIFQSKFQDNVTEQSPHRALSYIYDNTCTHSNLI